MLGFDRIAIVAVAAAIGVGGILIWGRAQRRKGGAAERETQRETDNATAEKIRDRVDDVRESGGVPKDKLQFRD